jgi:hypothetical protein
LYFFFFLPQPPQATYAEIMRKKIWMVGQVKPEVVRKVLVGLAQVVDMALWLEEELEPANALVTVVSTL